MAGSDPLSRFRRDTARKLRHDETEAERTLWRALSKVPLVGSHFRRQVVIGPFIADLACLAAKLVIEVDGSHHNDADQADKDERRTKWLESQGFRVLRFHNREVMLETPAVLETIYSALYGGPHGEAARLKHQRRSSAGLTPPRRPEGGDPPPDRGG
ncbi:endonuclease domain-containing protein [Segnochrobactrum spirostomi]|uniref:Endonuclease domain-containing protein n=1 Tax=Segnochrobactrum spirostomi TaxID=2608987 RepID=A0A6A7Y8D5_9HYPH|nr:DUF559 domain-containing protein [Segnochrobactrum spirostomi]MQT14251.1 endonuclease domain-containing protein [Segnochrobactrum spirostomi]